MIPHHSINSALCTVLHVPPHWVYILLEIQHRFVHTTSSTSSWSANTYSTPIGSSVARWYLQADSHDQLSSSVAMLQCRH